MTNNANEAKDLVLNAINKIMYQKHGFSDIQLQTDAPIMVRTSRGWEDGDSEHIPTQDSMREFFNHLDSGWEGEITKGGINKPLDIDGYRLRVNAYLSYSGTKLKASIRRVDVKAPNLKVTGLPASIRLLLENDSGLIIISGPTGSGKTTSMAAIIEEINLLRTDHILTIEDPIEYVFEPKKSLFSQQEVGVDCDSFLSGVKEAMRQKPEIIVIGEIRDAETAEQALMAGESGHLVLATMHASSAVGTITKLQKWFPNEKEILNQTLANSLVGIINQRLIPRKDESGLALAIDFISNHKRQFSKVIGDQAKMEAFLERNDDGVSVSLGDSITKLVADGIITPADALKKVRANESVYDKVKVMK